MHVFCTCVMCQLIISIYEKINVVLIPHTIKCKSFLKNIK